MWLKLPYFGILLAELWNPVYKGDPQPSIRGRVNRLGFDFAATAGSQILQQEIPKIKIPDQNFGVGVLSLRLYDFKVTSFVAPKFSYRLSTDGLELSSADGDIRVGCNYKAKNSFFSERGDGAFHAYGFNARIQGRIVNQGGKAAVQVLECDTSVSHVDIMFHGKIIANILRLAKGKIASYFKKALRDQICKISLEFVTKELNPFLALLPSNIPLGKGLFLNGALSGNPEFSADGVDVAVALSIVYGSDTCVPKRELVWPSALPNPAMASLLVDDSVANCLLDALHKAELFQFVLDKKVAASFLATTCPALCIGKFIPRLEVLFPNSYVKLLVSSSRAPRAIFKSSKAIVEGYFEANLVLDNITAPTKDDFLAGFIFNTSASGNCYFENHRFKGILEDVKSTLVVDFSKVGEIDQKLITNLNPIIAHSAMLLLGNILKQGFPLPTYDGIAISDKSHVAPHDDFVQADLFLEFVPGSLQ